MESSMLAVKKWNMRAIQMEEQAKQLTVDVSLFMRIWLNLGVTLVLPISRKCVRTQIREPFCLDSFKKHGYHWKT
jgi:hypothetical protein